MKASTPQPTAVVDPVNRKWPRVPLGDICRIDAPIVDPRIDEYRNLPHVSGEDIESGTGRLLALHSAAEDGMTSGKYLFDAEVVLYSKLRPYLRKVAVADFRGLCSADMYPLVFDRSRVCLDYAKFGLLSEEFTAYANEASARARMPKLNREQLLAYEFPLPPLEAQEQIAAELTKTLTAVDKARRAAQERLAAAEALPAAYLREVFGGPEASRWQRLPIAILGDPARGDAVQTGPFGAQLPSSEFKSEGVPVLNIGNVKNGGLDLKRLDHVTPEKAADLERYHLREGDMLFTRSGSVGRSAIVTVECHGWLMSYHLLRVAFDRRRVEPGFASAAVRGDETVLRQVRLAAGRGATRDGVNASILGALTIPVPPIEVQQRVLSDLSRLLATTEALIALCREELDAIESIPAALLRSSFNGNH